MSVHKQKDKKAAKHKLFLDAATSIFSSKGFQNSKVVDIVHETNSGQGTFYYHFKDKQAIFDELMIAFIDRLTQTLMENDAAGPGPGITALASREISIRNARAIASVFLENLSLAKLFFNESRYLSGAGMERVEMFYALLYWQIESGIKEGKAAGQVRPDVDPYIVARCMVGAIERVIYEAVRTGPPADIDSLVSQIVDFQSVGILVK